MAKVVIATSNNTVVGGVPSLVVEPRPRIWKGTQAQYNALTESQKDNYDLFGITD